jgi:hypothetical protein
MQHRPRLLLAAGLLAASSPSFADARGGPDPYAAGYGFDLPSEAAWGGWRRGDAGTLYAEWDVLSDPSHGAGDDRSAAPDAGGSGASSAWLGWNAGTFATGGGNLYSFTVPESFSIELAGPLPAVPLRVALQVESQGQPLDPDSFTLNDQKPAQRTQTYRDPAFPSPQGPTDLVHRLLIWELPAPPAGFVFRFGSKAPHVSLTQAAVDIGPETPAAPGPDSDPAAGQDRTVLVKLPAETLDADLATRLHAQRPAWFPKTWADRELAFTRKTDRGGKRITRSLRGGIQALFRDEAAGGSTNRVFVDLYRPDPAGDAKIAVCPLKATKKRRWRTVTLDSGTARFGTAVYRLDLRAVEFPDQPRKSRLANRLGLCDVDTGTDGVQPGIPELREGDYAVFGREDG